MSHSFSLNGPRYLKGPSRGPLGEAKGFAGKIPVSSKAEALGLRESSAHAGTDKPCVCLSVCVAPDGVAYEEWRLFLVAPEAGRSTLQVPAGAGSGRPAPHETPSFFVLMRQEARGHRGPAGSLQPFSRGLNATHRGSTPMMTSPPKGPTS